MIAAPGHFPLTPISFLQRAAAVFSDLPAVSWNGERTSYAGLLARVERLAGALRESGVSGGDRVAVALPNTPAMIESHFAVPGMGAVLVPLNIRLAAREIAYIFEESQPRCLIADPAFRERIEQALDAVGRPPTVIWSSAGAEGDDYEARLAAARPAGIAHPADEMSLLSINYTSGTTGAPKGVMYTHRGAHLHTLGVIAECGISSATSYLWTLPMFHCHGWAFVWAVTAMGARHVCLRSVDPAIAWELIDAEGVTHLAGAPTVLTMLIEASEARARPLRVYTGGAPPAPALLARCEARGWDVTHLYGLTETYGPQVACVWRPEWDSLPAERRARLKARQGVATVVSQPPRVVDDSMRDVPADGATLGEVVLRGNNVTIGYYRDEQATSEAFSEGWFRSGDLGVMHGDGYLELRDRRKDVVISGGENISSIEVEQAIAAHPSVSEAAVVGIPDDRFGERPKAFVTLQAGRNLTASELQEFLRGRLAGFKVPRAIEFVSELPRTATGKIRKFELRT